MLQIVPTTFKSGEATDFMLRIFTENSNVRQVKRLDKEVPELTIWRKMACIKKPSLVTKIKVLEAHGLEKIDKFGGYLNVTLNSDEIIENNATFFYRTRYLLHGGM